MIKPLAGITKVFPQQDSTSVSIQTNLHQKSITATQTAQLDCCKNPEHLDILTLEESDRLNPSPLAQEGTEETPQGEEQGLVRKEEKREKKLSFLC